jgi:two-component sensor histidine kinase
LLNTDVESPFFQITGLTRYSGEEGLLKDETLDYYENKKIQFYPSDYMIKLDVALLDYKSQSISYWYRIKGVVEEWFLLDGSSLTLGSLPFGDYTLELRALAEGGGNHFQELLIPIEIIKPFYLKMWFFITILIIVVVSVWIWIWLRGRVLRNRNQQLEKMVLKRTRDLKEALVDKDILLKELHHRVKNNLQLVISLLDLQKDQLRDEEAKKAINEGQMRLSSIAMIHQNFYNASDLSSISFDKFLIDLVKAVAISFGQERDDVKVQIQSQNMNIDIEAAIPLGLIVNELLTNAYKHIPLSYYPIKIQIVIKEIAPDELLLEFKDNGPGIPEIGTFEFPKSLGLKLIKGLTSQLRGQISYQNMEGSLFEVRFKRQLK